MTDIETPFTDDDEVPEDTGFVFQENEDSTDFDFDKMFGEDADLSMVYPPDGWYNAVVKGVLHQEKTNTDGPNTGKVSRGWNISVQIDQPSGPLASYNGTFFGKYIWLGFKPQWTPNGLRELCAFLTATTGEKWEGRNVNFKEFRPEVRDVRGRRNVAMSYFDEMPVSVRLSTVEEVDKRDGESKPRTKIVGWRSVSDYELDEDPY
jgi:hypothetical protein